MMRCRFGLTLVEWVVVMLCIAVVMALMIPAINNGRDRGYRRNQCSTNLKNFALAATLYHNSKGHFPGYINDYGTFDTNVSSSAPGRPDITREQLHTHRKIGTWAVSLLPSLDAQPTYEQWIESRYAVVVADASIKDVTLEGYLPMAAPNLAIFECPTNPMGDSNRGGLNSYICNNGMHSRVGTDPAATMLDFEHSMSAANGVFNNQVACVDGQGQPVPIGPQVTMNDFHDGQGNTILFSENVQAMPWHLLGFATGRDLMVDDPSDPIVYPVAVRYVHGMVWHDEDDQRAGGASPVKPVHRINGNLNGTATGDIFTATMTPANASDLARPSSHHVEGVNAGMADGATRFISESIDYRVYQALLTPYGKHSDVPEPDYVLTDEAF